MASGHERYHVVADWDAYFEELERCPPAQQERGSEFVANVLPENPRAMRPPLLKKLHGAYAHLWQFECGGSRRLIYSVDDDSRTVRIEYFGPHPQWEKPGKLPF